MAASISEIGTRVARIASLIGVLGKSDRAVSAWVRQRRALLAETGFSLRSSVLSRQSYVEIGRETALDQVFGREAIRLWISGPGGSGKSSLGFEAGRKILLVKRFVPVVVDFAWKGSLYDYVAGVLNEHGSGQGLTASFVRQLIRSGHIGIIVDGLSEIQRLSAIDDILGGIRSGEVRHAIITSRQSCPDPELFIQIQLGDLDDGQLDKLISTLVPKDSIAHASNELRRFSEGRGLSPLFARLAIEYLITYKSLPQNYGKIIQNYLISLRSKAPTSPSEGDFLRVCRLTAFACLADIYAPHDVSEDYLRGVLDAESNRNPFYDGTGSKVLPYALVTELRACGVIQSRIVNTVSRIDFVHHPIAEYLAAAHVLAMPPDSRENVLSEIRSEPARTSSFTAALGQAGA